MDELVGEVDPFDEAEFEEDEVATDDEEWLEEDALDEVEELHLQAMDVAEEVLRSTFVSLLQLLLAAVALVTLKEDCITQTSSAEESEDEEPGEPAWSCTTL